MTTLTTVVGGRDLTEQERQLLAAARAMTADARRCLIGMAQSIARGSPATPTKLTVVR